MMEVNNSNVSTGRVYTKVKRGMVFWYDSNPKSNVRDVVPTITVKDKSYRDNIISGSRPWVVVSSDYINRQNRVVTVVPMSLDAEKIAEDETKVGFTFLGKKIYVLCEQIRTINNAELVPDKFVSFLEEETMEKIDKVMVKTLSIKEQEPITIEKLISERSMEKLEGVINAIVQKRVIEAKRQMELEKSQSQIDDAVLRITQGLADMYDITVPDPKDKSKSGTTRNKDTDKSINNLDSIPNNEVVNSGVEEKKEKKKVSVYINTGKKGEDKSAEDLARDFKKKYIDNGDGYYNGDNYHIEPKKSSIAIRPITPTVDIGTVGHREFTDEVVSEFMTDYSTMYPEDFCKKWGYKNKKSASQMRTNLVKKFGLDPATGKRVK